MYQSRQRSTRQQLRWVSMRSIRTARTIVDGLGFEHFIDGKYTVQRDHMTSLDILLFLLQTSSYLKTPTIIQHSYTVRARHHSRHPDYLHTPARHWPYRIAL